MTTFRSGEQVLDFAIAREEAAARGYRRLAAMTDKADVRRVFEDFAAEEEAHRERLLAIKAGKASFRPGEVRDLGIADRLVDPDPDAKPGDYQHALILAMKAEKEAWRLYTELARAAADPQVQATLLAMAREEAAHKLRFESEYDEEILREN